jgi:predicted DNA-binding transcriptional regulator YafY
MAKVGFYKRYLYIVDRLQTVPTNFKDLQQIVKTKLENDDLGTNFDFSLRTFDRDKKDIADLFGIYIKYNRKDKVYHIDEDIDDPAVSKMIEAFSLHQALKLGGNKITQNIFLEKRKSSGTNLINGVLHAIQNHLQVSFTHIKFWEMETTHRTVKPIAIKESQHRWYLIAWDNNTEMIKNFGFDRISNFIISDTKFKPITQDLDKKYQHAFGIETYRPAERIVLEFSRQQGNYIRSFPLHTSQKIVSDTEDSLVIELFMHPTNDIIMELMKYSSEVKVIEPEFMKTEIRERATAMMKLYS